MIKLIAEWSNYIFIIMCVIYAISCFTVFLPSSPSAQVSRMNRQEFFMFLFHFICYAVLYAVTKDTMMLIMYVAQAVFFKVLILIYQHVYPDCSRIMVNHMCFLMMIGFVMLSRIGLRDYAVRQCIIAGVFSLVVLAVPVFVEKAVWLRKLRWAYGVLGLCFLMSVKVIGRTINGSTNWISLGPVSVQPMEFVKISYIFFIASMLGRRPNFKRIFLTSLFCAAHVMVLILENDLGGALLYFVVFILMCFVATGRLVYLFGGTAAGAAAGWMAYMARPHVRTRFYVWHDPFADPLGRGYQMIQSLFALGSGGWFGTGLTVGSPYFIPVVASDFIFAAIVEELGAIFGICLILIYIGIFIHFLRIAMDVEDRFYKLIGYGFSACFIFQVFLSVGGVIKFIPSTGVTLPLISYGGSSVISTLAIFGIMQGVFMIAYTQDPEEEYIQAGVDWFDESRPTDPAYTQGFRDGYRKEGHDGHPAVGAEIRRKTGGDAGSSAGEAPQSPYRRRSERSAGNQVKTIGSSERSSGSQVKTFGGPERSSGSQVKTIGSPERSAGSPGKTVGGPERSAGSQVKTDREISLPEDASYSEKAGSDRAKGGIYGRRADEDPDYKKKTSGRLRISEFGKNDPRLRTGKDADRKTDKEGGSANGKGKEEKFWNKPSNL